MKSHVASLLEPYKNDLLAFKNQPFKTIQLKDNTIPLIYDYPQLLWHELDIEDGWTNWKEFKASKRNFLYAVSGAGKTRMMFEWLAREWGFYFVCQGGIVFGSADFDHAVESVKTAIVEVESYHHLKKMMQRFSIAKSLFRILFLCRYCVMKYVKKNLKYSPLNWLQLQVLRLDKDGELIDILDYCFKSVLKKFSSVGLPNKISRPLTVIDEAQYAFGIMPNTFPSVTDYEAYAGSDAALSDTPTNGVAQIEVSSN